MNQFLKLTRLSADDEKGKEELAWVNAATIFRLETGIRKKDQAKYTVVISTSPGDQKIIVKETPEEIDALMFKVKQINIML